MFKGITNDEKCSSRNEKYKGQVNLVNKWYMSKLRRIRHDKFATHSYLLPCSLWLSPQICVRLHLNSHRIFLL